MKTLLIGNIHPAALNLLQEKTELVQVTQEEFEQQPSFPETEAVVLRTFTEFQTQEIAKFPKLRYVVSCSVGINNLDLKLLQEKNIELVHCAGTNANSVAEHTLYFMLALLRQDVQKPFVELKGKTVGILGLGAIGKLVAKKLQGFEIKAIAFDVIEQDPKVLDELQVEMKDFDSVLREADIVTVHVPLNKHTENLITATSFERMRGGSFFINTSRAEVVNERDLLDEIRDGRFRGVAVDVCSAEFVEQVREKHVIITDHCAAQGEDSFRTMCETPVREFLHKIISTEA